MKRVQTNSAEMQALQQINEFGKTQIDATVGLCLCPRCGKDKMRSRLIENARSRHAEVYVCPDCGTDEALNDMTGRKLLSSEWWMVQELKESEGRK